MELTDGVYFWISILLLALTIDCCFVRVCYPGFVIPPHAARRAMAEALPPPKQQQYYFLHDHIPSQTGIAVIIRLPYIAVFYDALQSQHIIQSYSSFWAGGSLEYD